MIITGSVRYTMIDVTRIPGNKVEAESYRVTMSRGGVNKSTDRSVVTLDGEALESFLARADALLRLNSKVLSSR